MKKSDDVVVVKTISPNGDAVQFGTVRYTKNENKTWSGDNGTTLTHEEMIYEVEEAKLQKHKEVISGKVFGG